MFRTTEDIHIQWTKVVLPPVFLEEEFPVTEAASETIFATRNEINEILSVLTTPARARGSLLHSRHKGSPRIRRAAQGGHCGAFARSAHRDARLL